MLLFLFWPLACVPCCLDACKGECALRGILCFLSSGNLTRLIAEEIYEDVYITPAILAAPQPQQIFLTHTHVQANV